MFKTLFFLPFLVVILMYIETVKNLVHLLTLDSANYWAICLIPLYGTLICTAVLAFILWMGYDQYKQIDWKTIEQS